MKTQRSHHTPVHHDVDTSVKTLKHAAGVGKPGHKNVVVTDKQKHQAKHLDHGKQPTIDRSAKEEGHGGGKIDNSSPPPSAAQLEFERKAKEREDVIKQNAAIKESNSNLNTQIGNLETARAHLSQLANIADLSASFTRGELNDFANSLVLSPEMKAAARWLLAQDDFALASLGLKKGEGGVTKESINAVLGALDGKIAGLKAQIRPEVPVPGEPTPPPPSSSANPSTGTGGTSGNGAAPTNGSVPTKTPEQANAEMFPSFSQLPEFSSSATTGEGRMQDGANHLQKSLDALEKDLAAAAAKGDQAAMTAINNKISKLQAGMSALMQMMKQRQEMESNMAKMFSEMAMSSIRNMR